MAVTTGGSIRDLTLTTNATGDANPLTQGPSAELINSNLHGKYYAACRAGRVFAASTLAAGIVVPFIAATVASKFSLYNASTTSKLVELIGLSVLQVPGSSLITGLGMAFQGPLASTGGVPGTLTVSTGQNACLRVGAGGPSTIHYSAATLTNVAIANLSPVIWCGPNSVATTTITQGPTWFFFDGMAIMPPDTVNALVDSITGTQSAAAVTAIYAEWPL